MIIHNALHVKSMDVCLLNPFIMRLAGIHVDDSPKFLAMMPSVAHHSLYFPSENIRISLALNGIVSYFPCRKPRGEEISNPHLILHLTPRLDSWNPHDDAYQRQEEAMVDFSGDVKQPAPKKFIVSSFLSRSAEPSLFASDLISNVGSFSKFRINSVKCVDGKDSVMDPLVLARNWNVSVDTAKRTIQGTTRLCPRNTTTISLHKRYASNDRMIRYKHLNCTMFSDTMFASAKAGKSVRNFTCVQVFVTDFGWCMTYNLDFERNIHTAFKRLFKEIGVPLKMVMDGAKAQVSGETKKICDEVGCQINELEKYTPASNRAERMIQQLKLETRRDMKLAGSPLVLWCYCVDRRSEIIACCARNNYNLDGQVPRTYMTGELTDISHVCNFKWYKWVKFRRIGPEAAYPFPTEHLGRCLGPARNQGNAMSQHVLLENGKVIPIQTLRSLTQAEVDSPLEKSKRDAFDEAIKNLYGDHKAPPSDWIKRRKKSDIGPHHLISSFALSNLKEEPYGHHKDS